MAHKRRKGAWSFETMMNVFGWWWWYNADDAFVCVRAVCGTCTRAPESLEKENQICRPLMTLQIYCHFWQL
jgi:hypothetical protein